MPYGVPRTEEERYMRHMSLYGEEPPAERHGYYAPAAMPTGSYIIPELGEGVCGEYMTYARAEPDNRLVIFIIMGFLLGMGLGIGGAFLYLKR